MKKKLTILILIGVFGFAAINVQAQFTAGNLAIFVAASNVTNTTGSIVEINKTGTGQSAISSYSIPASTGTLSNQLRFNGKGQATGTCYLSNSNDLTYLSFTGANTIDALTIVGNITQRGVGTFNGAGTYNLATTYTAPIGNYSARGATTLNNTDWYIADAGGFYTNGSSSSSPATDTRSVKSFGGTVYGHIGSPSSTPVFTISGTSGTSYTNLPGLSMALGTYLDFFLISSGSNGNYDVLYIIMYATIYKYSLVSGSWTINGSYAGLAGISNHNWNLAAESNGSGAYLYITAGDGGSTAANSVYRYVDQAGYNSDINISGTRTTLYTATGTNIVKGIGFVPNKETLGSLNTAGTNHVIASTLTAKNTTKPVFGFSLTSEGLATLSALTLTVSRSISTSDISNVKLWNSSTNDYNTGTLTQVGTTVASPSGTSITFSGLSKAIGNGSANYLFVTCDVASGVTVSTSAIQISLPSTGITATGTNLTGGTITGINYSFKTFVAWDGSEGTDWNTAGNWSTNAVPTASDDVIIPDVANDPVVNEAPGTPAVCNDLTIESGAVLTIAAGKALTVNGTLTNNNSTSGIVIQSDATGTGSLINGTSGVSATVERYMTGDIWHLISPPATTGTILAFTGASGNSIGFKSSTSHYALAPYDVSTDTWTYYAHPTPSGTFDTQGKGYQVLRGSGSPTGNGNVTYDGVVTFTGTLAAASVTEPVSSGGFAWNLIGNPYPCALNIADFITENTSLIDPSYHFIYVSKVGDISNYGDEAEVSRAAIPPAEGFFIKSVSGGGTVNFTTAMKSASSDAFKSAIISFPIINLSAETATDKMNTTVNYMSGMTNGLDPGYDAGLFNGGGLGSFSLSTRLIQDNGVDFQIQCLPDNDYGNMVVPVGLVAASGSAVTFKAAATNLPSDLKVVLEDRVANTFTQLDGGGTYTVTLNTASTGPGRFFLRTTTIVSAVPGDLTVELKVVPLPNQQIIQVYGNVNLPARALVYDMNGKLMTAKTLTGIDLNEIPLVNAANGLYLLKIESNNTPLTKKVVWIKF